MLDILRDLFTNFLIITASLTFGNLLLRDYIVKKTSKNILVFSALFGIIGCILMLYSVHVSPTIIIDFRYIPIVLMGIYFSLRASTITALFIGFFRVVILGINNASIIAFIIAVIVGVICGLIGKSKLTIRSKWILSILSVIIFVNAGLIFLMFGEKNLVNIILAYLTGTLLAFVLTYYFVKYTIQVNEKYFLIKEASNKDFLTGLYNFRHFDTALNVHLANGKKNGSHISLLFIDLDFFKKVNDVYGHLNGDMVLKEVAQILIELSRDIDIVTRRGGEEFTVLLINCRAPEALAIAERIRKTIEEHIFISDKNEKIKITVSIGASSFPETTSQEERLIEQADIALYNSKRSGRNKVCIADIDV